MRSCALRSSSGAPNSPNAAKAALPFSGSALIRISRSLVARGRAWNETAYPPTTRYLTWWAFNADKSSLKSGYTSVSLHAVKLEGQLHYGAEPFARGQALPRLMLGPLHRLETLVTRQRLVHPSKLTHPGNSRGCPPRIKCLMGQRVKTANPLRQRPPSGNRQLTTRQRVHLPAGAGSATPPARAAG